MNSRPLIDLDHAMCGQKPWFDIVNTQPRRIAVCSTSGIRKQRFCPINKGEHQVSAIESQYGSVLGYTQTVDFSEETVRC